MLLRQYFVHNIFRHFAIKYNHKNNYNAGKESHIGYSWFTNKVHLLYKEIRRITVCKIGTMMNAVTIFCLILQNTILPRPDRATRSHVSVSTSLGSYYTNLQKAFVATLAIVDFFIWNEVWWSWLNQDDFAWWWLLLERGISSSRLLIS